jgi:hypothetical protein
MNILSRIFGAANRKERRALRGQIKRFRALNQITAASKAPGQNWPGITTSYGDDSLNRSYLQDLADVQSRAQDIDVNNPDIHGFHRARTAQVLGAGVQFKLAPHSSEVGLDQDALLTITQRVNRIRQIHSRQGGFDASGLRRSEGKQQERAFLTALVLGSCLIHRVWRTDGKHKIPLSLELIPGTRISTPYDKMGDPLVSYGVKYADEHRSRIVGWYVRRVSKTIGNSFVPDYIWDFIPVADGSLLSLTEIAGIDRSLPLSTSTLRMLRNRGEFLEASVESARAQASHYATTECAEGADPYAVASDDASTDGNMAGAMPVGFTRLGSVQMLYNAQGEKTEWAQTKLPAPDLPGFMGATDERISRGLVSSLGAFTRKVINSYAGGRMEEQQDDPIIAQYRNMFISSWQVVNEWFLEAVWLTDTVALTSYSTATASFWAEFRAQFPAKLHINPVDTMKARELGYMQRTTTPQRECEADGTELRNNLNEWGEAMKMVKDKEVEFGLPEGSLAFLISGRTMSTTGGDVVGAPEPAKESEPGAEPQPANRMRGLFLNRLKEKSRE